MTFLSQSLVWKIPKWKYNDMVNDSQNQYPNINDAWSKYILETISSCIVVKKKWNAISFLCMILVWKIPKWKYDDIVIDNQNQYPNINGSLINLRNLIFVEQRSRTSPSVQSVTHASQPPVRTKECVSPTPSRGTGASAQQGSKVNIARRRSTSATRGRAWTEGSARTWPVVSG